MQCGMATSTFGGLTRAMCPDTETDCPWYCEIYTGAYFGFVCQEKLPIAERWKTESENWVGDGRVITPNLLILLISTYLGSWSCFE